MDRLPLSRGGRSALEVAVEAAVAAGRLLLQHYSWEKKIEYKAGRANIVTDVDLLADKAILEALQAEYPDHNILSEESAETARGSSYTWIIDPIDGTNNYTFGIPLFCVTLALAHDGEVLLGVTYDPLREELFYAIEGMGAFLNGNPISASRRASVKASLIGCDLGYISEAGRQMIDIIRGLWPDLHGFRVMGSAALGLAYVACGRLDLYVHPWLYPWDIAGGILMVNESGGKITDWKDQPATIHSQRIIASNHLAHQEFLRLAQDNLRVPE